MNSLMSEFIEKEYRMSVVSLFLFYFVLFGLPDISLNRNCLVISIFVLSFYVLLQGLSKNVRIREIIFRKYLVNLEIYFRENGLEHEYYALNDDNKREIDKIDKYIDILFSKYILSISWVLLFSIEIILYILRVLQLNSLDFQFFSIPGYGIIIFAIIGNFVNIITFKSEFTQYIANYEKIYTIFWRDKERTR